MSGEALRVSIAALNRCGVKRYDFRTLRRNGVTRTTCAIVGMLGHPLEVDAATKTLTIDDPVKAREVAAYLAQRGVDCSPELF